MLKTAGRVCFAGCVGLLCVLMACAVLFPEEYRKVVPYRFYNVLTSSMEPTVKANSLVLVKACDDDWTPEPGDIITFHANRFGERVIITHRFSHTEINGAGETVYRTHPEGSDTLDHYQTTREDILGVYLWHIPYAGKLILFLKSAFGLLWICQMILIFLVKALVAARWKETGDSGGFAAAARRRRFCSRRNPAL